MKMFYYKSNNVGDAISPVIVSHFFNEEAELVNKDTTGKLLGIGSVMWALREGDVVWGSGIIQEDSNYPIASTCKFLAVRGKLSEKILGVDVGVYGDPALLLPLIYNPEVEQIHEVGIIEHYVDKGLYKDDGFRIDVEQDWKSFVNEVKSCKRIVSSSLHGLIIPEAYGIPVEWVVLSDKVIGNGFKFRDYLSGTDRTTFEEPLTKEKLKEIQDKLIKVIK